MDLAVMLGADWTATRQSAEWTRALDELEAIRAPVTAESRMLPLYDLALGQLWFLRAEATEDLEDERVAIGCLEQARAGVNARAGVYLTASTHLGTLRLQITLRTGDPFALAAAVEDLALVIDAERARPWERARCTALLPHALWARYERARDSDDLAMAIELCLSALTVSPMEIDDETAAHALLGSLYAEVFTLTGDLAHLDASIVEHELGLARPARGGRIDAVAHDNAGNAYSRRFKRTHRQGDLDRAIAESRIALALAPADSDCRARMWTNLSISLLEQGLRSGQRRLIDEAVQAARTGLSGPADGPDVGLRLTHQLAKSLLARHAVWGPPSDSESVLNEAMALLERALAGQLSSAADLPVRQRLGSRALVARVQSMLVGLNLARSRSALTRTAAQRHLDLAFAIGEVAKAPLLTHEALRRELTPPPELDEHAAAWEAQLLGEAAGLDLRELLEDTADASLLIRRIHRRQLIHRQLTQAWEEMSHSTSSAVRRHARLRQDDATVLAESLSNRPEGSDLVSLVASLRVDGSGRDQLSMCFLILRDGADHAEVLCETDTESVQQAVSCLSAWAEERTSQSDETHASLAPLVSALGLTALKSSRCLAISPTQDTFSLPWQMLLSMAGWRNGDGGPVPAVVVPSHALSVMRLDGNEHASIEDVDMVGRFGLEGIEGLAPSVRFRTPDATRPTFGTVVVGNPTGDLPRATDEARAVAALRGVEPILGASATQAVVVAAVERASVVHIATHVTIDAGQPLRSTIALADTDLLASALLGRRGAAQLVVLSACHSGYGRTLGGGEVMGLSTALLRAGAYAVVASSWEVDDAATEFLMTRFHALCCEGLSAAAALAQASSEVSSEPGWDAPYYWAAFTLVARRYSGVA